MKTNSMRMFFFSLILLLSLNACAQNNIETLYCKGLDAAASGDFELAVNCFPNALRPIQVLCRPGLIGDWQDRIPVILLVLFQTTHVPSKSIRISRLPG